MAVSEAQIQEHSGAHDSHDEHEHHGNFVTNYIFSHIINGLT